MKKRGRQSTTELGTVTAIVERRPPAPAHLTEFQAEIWRTVVGTKPGDWFRPDTHELLAAYCQHVAAARVLSAQVDEFEPEWIRQEGGIERFGDLLKLRDRETRAMTSLARAMRITQQSQIQPRSAARRSSATLAGAAPWDVE